MQDSGLDLLYSCPIECEKYRKPTGGFKLLDTFRKGHTKRCYPHESTSFYRCPFSSKCAPKRGPSRFTAPGLRKHLMLPGCCTKGSLEDLVRQGTDENIAGRLAVNIIIMYYAL